jgi:hypothetical protein
MLIAILSGCDWSDAGVDHLVLPEGFDFDAQETAYMAWYHTCYVPSLSAGEKMKYQTLREWMITHGAREPTDSELHVIDRT